MSTRFGTVAGDYDRLRPGYPASIADAVLAVIGAVPPVAVEIGAGTGKATGVFRCLGDRLTCVEPDTRMAARLRRRFPTVEIVTASLEAWEPPTGGVPLILGALVWHLLDPGRRCRLVHAALAPGGHVALVGRRNLNVNPGQDAAVREAVSRYGWAVGTSSPHWIGDDLRRSGLFGDVSASRHDTLRTLSADDYLRLVSTYSPFLALDPARQGQLLTALGAVVAAHGGVVRERLQTTVYVARRS